MLQFVLANNHVIYATSLEGFVLKLRDDEALRTKGGYKQPLDSFMKHYSALLDREFGMKIDPTTVESFVQDMHILGLFRIAAIGDA